jgi:hypothetical protein
MRHGTILLGYAGVDVNHRRRRAMWSHAALVRGVLESGVPARQNTTTEVVMMRPVLFL